MCWFVALMPHMYSPGRPCAYFLFGDFFQMLSLSHRILIVPDIFLHGKNALKMALIMGKFSQINLSQKYFKLSRFCFPKLAPLACHKCYILFAKGLSVCIYLPYLYYSVCFHVYMYCYSKLH